MKSSTTADLLWGNRARFSYLLIAAAILLFTLLGAREIWTQEHRWADIVSGMFYRHDFLHPYLGESNYYDKPLLSYWLIAIVAKITGLLSTWTLRFPSALSGLLAIWAIYHLGTKIKNQQLGLLSGWLLLTTFYFLFWARTSSADMLNMAGSLLAIAWYFDKRKTAGFCDYAVFFIIIALTSLCKGLIGIIVPLIAVFVDMCLERSFRKHLRWPLFLAIIPAAIIYLSPFIASSYFSNDTYSQNGLYLVYRENILRYLKPFDHQGPIYTYFIYLPIYLLPWALFFIPALWALKNRWRLLSDQQKWVAWTLLCLFLFFTLSGSRRSYYVLPMVPFAILFTADWILAAAPSAKRYQWAARVIIISFLSLFLVWDVFQGWYYSYTGVNQFTNTLKQEAAEIKPWNTWNVVLLDAESKLTFYLQLPPTVKNYQVKGTERKAQTSATLLKAWPILQNKPKNTIFITRKFYLPLIKEFFNDYRLVDLSKETKWSFLKKADMNTPIAFIPK